MYFWKPTTGRQNPTEIELLKLATEAISAEALTMIVLEQQAPMRGRYIDAIVEITWQGRRERYACEIKGASTPRALEAAIAQASFAGANSNLRPLILVPYLSEEKLRILAEQEVSAMDASGNAFLQSDQFLFWRSGQPNRFRTPSQHLNPFRGDNSIFSRCFLLRREFESLSELRAFATKLMERPSGQMERERLLLGTASKTVQALEEQLIVQKTRGMLKLLDRRKLLTQLRLNYQPPIGRKVVGKIPFDRFLAWDRLRFEAERKGFRIAATGTYSATFFGVLSPSEKLSVYVDDLDAALNALEFTEAKAFANCELIETRKNFPYFDLQWESGITWASPIQSWLELANGTSREQEAGQDLERMILHGGWGR